MKIWREAWVLAKHELHASAIQMLISWLLLSCLGLLFLTSFTSYLDENYIGFDIMFLFLFSYGPYLTKARHFQYNKVFGRVWASPVLVMQLQLPIPLNILVRSRLLIYLTYFVPFFCFTFVMMYIANSQLNGILSLSEYLVFFFIWLAISLFIGIILPASDVGDFITPMVMIRSIIIIFLCLFIPIAFFYGILNIGIVAWTIHFATTTPFLALSFSLIILIIISLFWPYYMKKTVRKLDYM